MSPATEIVANPGTYLPEESDRGSASEVTVKRTPVLRRIKTGLKCPSCKSPKICYSTSFTVFDGLLGIFALRALRCHSCYCKFHRLFA